MVKIKNRPTDLLDLLVLSSKRRKVLGLLREGPKTLEEIRDSLKATSSGLLPQIRKLEKADMVYQKEWLYGLTELGELTAHAFYRFFMTLEVIGENEEFWAEHRINEIPEPFRKRIHELGRSKIVHSKPTDIFEPHIEFMEMLSRSSKVLGVSPIFHPDYPSTLLEMGKGGAEVSVVVTREVFDRIKKEYEEDLRNFLGLKNTSFMVYNGDIGIAITATDVFLSLGLFLENGIYDLHRDLISFEKSALKWGEDLFNYYKKRSKLIHDL